MNFIKRILSSLISAARGGARRRSQLAVCLLSVAAAAASLTYFQPRRAQAQQTPATLRGAAALEQLKQNGQYESLQAAMNQARFSVSRAENTPLGRAAWHAPNRSAGYDAYVTEAGVSIALNDQTIVGLNLHSLGYGHAMQGVAPGKVSGDKQTINITRDNGVREWYVNGPEGLEHGFTLSEPPGARHSGVPLRLALQVSKGWRAAASEDGKSVTLRGASVAVEYGKLVVSDSLGRNIPARLTVDEEQVVIEVEDHDAAYPLTIDPIFTLQQKLMAADGTANERFGEAVALSGDTVVVGVPFDNIGWNPSQGSAYVFTRSGGTWTLHQILTAYDGAPGDFFGYAVALDGDTLAVGAYADDISPNANQGSVYVFTRSGAAPGAIWTIQQKLFANDGAAEDYFGRSVAISGDTLVVGAPSDTTGTMYYHGSAYVFTRSGGVWSFQKKLTAHDGAMYDQFGYSVAISGNTVVAGAFSDDNGSKADQGSAHVFVRSNGVWSFQQKLTANDGEAMDQFGAAVAISGDTIIAGAPLDDVETDKDAGSAYVFVRSGTVWTRQEKMTGLSSDNLQAGALFGSAVAISGDTAIIGVPLHDTSGNIDQGKAVVNVRSGGVWSHQRNLRVNDGEANDRFGSSIALNGDTALIGANFDDIGTGAGLNPDQGSAYLFTRSAVDWAQRQKFTARGGAAREYFGQAVALSGDRVIVGAPHARIGANLSQGAVYVFGCGYVEQPKLPRTGAVADDGFGFAVAIAGDTAVVGAPLDDVGTKSNQGSAYVFTRSGAGWTRSGQIFAPDGKANDKFGYSVAIDYTPYGYTIVIGAPKVSLNGAPNRGAVYIFTPFDGR